MNVSDKTFDQLNRLFWDWLSINDLDEKSIIDPVRAAAFGFYVAHNSNPEEIDQWDVREFIQIQLDSDSLFGVKQSL